MCIIKHLEIILKKKTLLEDSLLKAESKREESTQNNSDAVLVEILRTREEENERLKAQMVDFTEAQKDLSKTVINLKI